LSEKGPEGGDVRGVAHEDHFVGWAVEEGGVELGRVRVRVRGEEDDGGGGGRRRGDGW